ncbi:hypothetical protein AMTRI_Chr07g27610 [Amborella trichopoda]
MNQYEFYYDCSVDNDLDLGDCKDTIKIDSSLDLKCLNFLKSIWVVRFSNVRILDGLADLVVIRNKVSGFTFDYNAFLYVWKLPFGKKNFVHICLWVVWFSNVGILNGLTDLVVMRSKVSGFIFYYNVFLYVWKLPFRKKTICSYMFDFVRSFPNTIHRLLPRLDNVENSSKFVFIELENNIYVCMGLYA